MERSKAMWHKSLSHVTGDVMGSGYPANRGARYFIIRKAPARRGDVQLPALPT